MLHPNTAILNTACIKDAVPENMGDSVPSFHRLSRFAGLLSSGHGGGLAYRVMNKTKLLDDRVGQDERIPVRESQTAIEIVHDSHGDGWELMLGKTETRGDPGWTGIALPY
jgi:hypothetical protein